MQLGHLKEVEVGIDDLEDDGTVYYVPHHPVIRIATPRHVELYLTSLQKADNNISLNDLQLAGPTIQCELFDILLRFRLPYYVLTADISKMYRQRYGFIKVRLDSKECSGENPKLYSR